MTDDNGRHEASARAGITLAIGDACTTHPLTELAVKLREMREILQRPNILQKAKQLIAVAPGTDQRYHAC